MSSFAVPQSVIFHELGHLVAAVASNSDFTHVQIDPVLGRGRVDYDHPICWLDAIPEVPLLLFLAGPIAQRILAPDSIKYGLFLKPLFDSDKERCPGWKAMGGLVSIQNVGWGYDLAPLYDTLSGLAKPSARNAEIRRYAAAESKLEEFFRQEPTDLAIKVLFPPLHDRLVLTREEVLEILEPWPRLTNLP